MVTFELATLIAWLTELFSVYVFGDAFIAGIFGFVIIIIIAVRLGLEADSLIVLGIFAGTLFSQFVFVGLDIGLIFIIAISISIVAMILLRLMRR